MNWTTRKNLRELKVGLAKCLAGFVVLLFSVGNAFSLTLSSDQTTLSWSGDLENEISGYRIYFGSESGNYNQSIDAGASDSWAITGLDETMTYYFAITSHDSEGNESAFSNEVRREGIVGNAHPVAFDGVVETEAGQKVNFTLDGMDPDGDQIKFRVTSAPNKGYLSGATPNLTYTPAPGFAGADSFTMVSFDGEYQSAPATIFLVVNKLNSPPVALSKTVETEESTPVSIQLAGQDPDGDGLSYALLSATTNGTLTGATPNLVYTPRRDFSGTDQFSYRVTDGESESEPATIAIVVNEVNVAPIALEKSLVVDENSWVSVALEGQDADGDDLSYILLSAPVNGTLAGAAPNLIYTPRKDFTGTDQFSYRVTDQKSESEPATVSIAVNEVNVAPIALGKSVELDENGSISIALEAQDPNGDDLSYRLISQPKNGVLIGSAPNLVFIPKSDYTGSDQFSYSVRDGKLESGPAVVLIAVNPINNAPDAHDMEIEVQEDSSIDIVLDASDSDGDSLNYRVTPPIIGTLTGVAPNMTYVPPANYTGEDVFSYSVQDGEGAFAEANVILTVSAVNDPPTIDNATYKTLQNTPVSIQLTGNDIDGDTIRFSILTPPSNGYLNGSAPSFTYTSLPDFEGTDSFTFRANDGDQVSSTGTITIEVTGQDGSAAVTLAWSPNSEPDLGGYKIYYGGESRNYTEVVDVGNVSQKRLTELESNRTYFFALTAYNTLGLESDFSEEVAFTTLPDGGESLDQLIANSDSFTVVGDQMNRISVGDLLKNDTFTGEETISLVGVSSGTSNGGSVSVVNGEIVYVSASNFEGEDLFTYGIRVGGLQAIGFVTLNVKPKEEVVNSGQLKLTMNFEGTEISGGSGLVQFQMTGEVGKNYTLQWTDDFQDWHNLETVVPDASGTVIFSDSNDKSPVMRFYRVLVSENLLTQI